MKRGRNQRRRQGMNVNRALDSNGPDVRIRGTANQIYDKYLALARDANSSGDRVKAENYLQHAEHYFRVIRAMQPQMPVQSMNGDQQDGDSDQPQIGDGERRFNRPDQPQGGFGDDGEFEADQPESRFDPHPFAQERPERPERQGGDDGRRQHYQGRDHRGDRSDHRQDHRGDRRPDHRNNDHRNNDHRRDQRPDSRDRHAPEAREPRIPETREPRVEESAEEPRDFRQEQPGAEPNGDGRSEQDRRRRRRRPRPPIGADAGGESGADQTASSGSGEMAPETA